MLRYIRTLWRREEGQALPDYAIVTASITLIMIVIYIFWGEQVVKIYTYAVDGEMVGNASAALSMATYVPAVTWDVLSAGLSATSFNMWGQPVGSTYDVTTDINAANLAEATSATLDISAYDIDFPGEVIMYINGNAYTLPATGDETAAASSLDINLSHLNAGGNTITFKFADDAGPPATNGYQVDNIALTLNR